MLFGDGTFTMGLVKGEERRLEVARVLRRLRDAFEAVVVETEGSGGEGAAARIAELETLIAGERGRAERAEARINDLEDELHRLASDLAEELHRLASSGERGRSRTRP
jgi:molybdenum-dependent DNA-binding transcriptional regulator ModE